MKHMKEYNKFDWGDFDIEEFDNLYNINDWVLVKGYDYGGEGNGIVGIIITRLIDINKKSTLKPTGLTRGDFIVYGKKDSIISDYKKISIDNIIRHATTDEIPDINIKTKTLDFSEIKKLKLPMM